MDYLAAVDLGEQALVAYQRIKKEDCSVVTRYVFGGTFLSLKRQAGVVVL